MMRIFKIRRITPVSHFIPLWVSFLLRKGAMVPQAAPKFYIQETFLKWTDISKNAGFLGEMLHSITA